MAPIVVRISWDAEKPLEMAGFANGTVTEMDANTNFPTPTISLTVMSVAAARVQNTYGTRKNGQVAKDAFDTAVTNLDALLHTQAHYVSDTANGDASIIHTGGWESTSDTRTKAPELDTPSESPSVDVLSGGIVNAGTKSDPDASLYLFVLVLGTAFSVTVQNNGQVITPLGTVSHVLTSKKSTVTFKTLPGSQPFCMAVLKGNSTGFTAFSPVTYSNTVG